MGPTYIDLTNELLRAFNEVELSESDFASARGAQGRAKDAIRSVVNDITQTVFTFPFNAAQVTVPLVIGQEEYTWPTDFSNADWESFQIIKDDTLAINHSVLRFEARDEWYQRQKDLDDDTGVNGRGQPTTIFRTHGNGFGVTPSPDKSYTLRYRYYTKQAPMISADDTTTIPNEFRHVIIAGASSYMNLFRDNVENMQLIEGKYKMLLAGMQRVLTGGYSSVRDRRIKF